MEPASPTRPRPTTIALLALAATLLVAGTATAQDAQENGLENGDAGPEEACAPQGFTAQALGVVVELKWEDVKDASSYHIFRAEGDGEAALVITMDAPANGTIDTQVEGGVTYTYTITAVVNGTESTPCDAVVVTANAEPCRPHLSVAAEEGPRNRLTWTVVTVADGYNVYRAEGSGDLTLLAELDANASGHVDADVEAGQAYRYQVRAVIGGEERPACNTVEATAVPVFPTLLVGALAGVVGVAAYAVWRRRG